MDISKRDWMLFRDRIGIWQEAYMAQLNQAYIDLLSGEGTASEKFWNLEDRIKKDKKSPGVLLELRKQQLPFDLLRLLCDGVIQENDLKGFSDALIEQVLFLYQSHQ